MKIKGSLGHTANTQNFENVRVDTGIEEYEVREGESIEEAFDKLYDHLENQLAKRLKRMIEVLGN
jgi:uncharacterized membrane-anchored protein